MEAGEEKGGIGSQRLLVRRARRSDFECIRELLGAGGHAHERRARKRFRKLVSSLAQDLYVAQDGEAVCGAVLIAYVKEADGRPAALVRWLRTSGQRLEETFDLLVTCAECRARLRGSAQIEISAAAVQYKREVLDALARRGYVANGMLLSRSLVKD